jgi:hypothetical protein
LLLVLLLLAGACTAAAQTVSKTTVQAMFRKMADSYRQAGPLSFDITYRYAAEKQPGVLLDSLKGKFMCSNDRYWLSMDNTESIYTGDYMIMLFGEDQLMYIAKPAQADNPAANMNPLQFMDSFLVRHPEAVYTLSETGNSQVIRIDLDTAAACKRVEYHIDKRTGYVTGMISIVNAEQFYDASVRPLLSGEKTYAIVEATYSNYRRATVDESQFAAARYFTKQGDRYVAANMYNNWQVFLGSPGL